MNLSFAGCGFLGIYHIGVASAFREYAPHVLVNKIAGASVGSIAAAALLCNVPLGQTTTDILRVAVQARSRTLGALNPRFDLNAILRDGLENALPENAHIICSGRLFVSCTCMKNLCMKNELISQFDTREELIQALLCSCFIPVYSGLKLPEFRGIPYIDGGASDNLPVLDENTVTISPFTGEHDINPQDDECSILQINLCNTSLYICPGNVYRSTKIFFPPSPEVLSKMCQQGFDDALKFLQRRCLITCTRCMAVQSTLSLTYGGAENITGEDSEGEHSYDDCLDCRYRRQMALLDSLPEAVVVAIQEVCDQVNKGVISWLFRHRPMKLLSVLSIPYVLSYDITILIFCKIWQKLPLLQKEIQSKFHSIVALIKTFLASKTHADLPVNAKFSCKLAIREFDYTEDTINSSFVTPQVENMKDTCTVSTEQEEVKTTATSNVTDEHNPPLKDLKKHRKSYAGFMSTNRKLSESNRRKSMCDIQVPERVLRNMSFGFTVNLSPTPSKKQSVMEAFEALGEEENEINVIDFANKALNWEKECIDKYHGDLEPNNAETLEKIISVTSNEAVMAYYYLDDNKTIQVTEVYNVDDADTSAVLSEEERETNGKLQWENEWLSDPNISCCDMSRPLICDTFDDKEFDMSDNELDILPELKESEPPISDASQKITPQRKKSFIIVK